MTAKSSIVVAACVLALWSGSHLVRAAEADASTFDAMVKANHIVRTSVTQNSTDLEWYVEVQYFFSGQPVDARFRIELPRQDTPDAPPYSFVIAEVPVYGMHVFTAAIPYPGPATTSRVTVSLIRMSGPDYGKAVSSSSADHIIQWQTRDEKNFELAVSMIDAGSAAGLREARGVLERLVAKDAKLEPAYVELARVAMKSNWGVDGIHQAEMLLDSALKIRPDSANAKILLGYVYTHQKRYREAEMLFAAVARSSPPNLRLWTNWGEMLEAQGKPAAAISKYRETVSRPPGLAKYVGARMNAYLRLLALLEQNKDLDGLEAVYEQRMAEFGPGACYSAPYARFKLYGRGDVQGAIDLARGALNLDCDDKPAREILGLASYVQWARSSEPGSSEALNRARIYLPPGPRALYRLANDEITMDAARKLIASGEPIDRKDNDQNTALALALEDGKVDAIERLLNLGADPATPVGFGAVPVALMPVMGRDLDAIRALQGAGVDYSQLRFRGATAMDYAKQMDDEELLAALTRKKRAL